MNFEDKQKKCYKKLIPMLNENREFKCSLTSKACKNNMCPDLKDNTKHTYCPMCGSNAIKPEQFVMGHFICESIACRNIFYYQNIRTCNQSEHKVLLNK